ncbi:MAG: hypothetical protein JXM73_00675 [Anaerolineae bacterium]|nr:hypothetical protein [Anaerolineae bacterium]
MYNYELENDYARFKISQADRKAAEAWRFRHLKPKNTQVLSVILGAIHRFLQPVFHSQRAAIGPACEQPSC